MAIFTMLFRKMARNRWLVAGLWIGMVLCVALTSSLPMYRDAILQRMLLKELDKYYEKEGVHPGNLYAGVTLQISTRDKHPETIAWLEAVWRRHSGSAPDIRWLENFKAFQTIRMDLVPEDAATANPEKKRAGSVAMQTGLFDRVRLKDGRRLYLLAEGRLVNLAAGDGHPAEIMDMTFALQAMALKYVNEAHESIGRRVVNVPYEIDEQVARLKLESLGTAIDRLSDDQKRYLESWKEH